MLSKDQIQAQIDAFKGSNSSEAIPKRSEQSTYFGFILYPDEDFDHKKMLDYISIKATFFRHVYILHDQDNKKPHVHLMIKTLDRMTPGSVVKWFGGWIDHAECIHSPKHYILYMLHCSPREMLEEGNHVYSVDDLRGDPSLWKGILIQNSHFVQLRDLLFYQPFGGTFIDTFENIPDSRKRDLGEFMWDNRFFVKSILDQEANRYYECPIDNGNVVKSHLYSSIGCRDSPTDLKDKIND